MVRVLRFALFVGALVTLAGAWGWVLLRPGGGGERGPVAASGRPQPPGPEEEGKAAPAGLPTQVTEMLQAPFAPSLEMRENVDFLLTPALLLQECVSPDVVITYPSD